MTKSAPFLQSVAGLRTIVAFSRGRAFVRDSKKRSPECEPFLLSLRVPFQAKFRQRPPEKDKKRQILLPTQTLPTCSYRPSIRELRIFEPYFID